MKVLWFGSETDEVKVRRLMTTEAVARVLELASFHILGGPSANGYINGDIQNSDFQFSVFRFTTNLNLLTPYFVH